MTFLETVTALVQGPRPQAYGPPQLNHACTAELWRAWLLRRFGVDLALTPRDVCLLNILQKLSRDANTPGHDNLLDVAGYAENAARCTPEPPCLSSAPPAGTCCGPNAATSPVLSATSSSPAAARAPRCPTCDCPDHPQHHCEGMEGL